MVEVAKSPNDPRSYRALHLPNGLQVLLIHDPEIDVTSQDGEPAQGIKKPKGAGENDDGGGGGEVMKRLAAASSVQVDTAPKHLTALVQGDSDMGSASGSDSGSGSEDEGGSGSEEDEDEDSPHEGRPGGKAVKRAAAALSVGIGHLSDPWQAQVESCWNYFFVFQLSQPAADPHSCRLYAGAQSLPGAHAVHGERALP